MHGHFFARCLPGFGVHAGRGRGHHGFGQFFRDGSGPDSFGPRDFRTGRKLSGDSLQLLILAMLDEQPRHGYEIIKELGERSGGFYTPSPGMVYPALTYLEEVGHARVEADGSKKRYLITDEGRAHLVTHRADADAMLQQLGWLADKMARVRGFFGRGGDSEHDDTPHGRRGSPELHAARHELREAFLARMRDASPEEERRIIDILKAAAASIRGAGNVG